MRVTDNVYQAAEVMGGPTILLGDGYVTLVDAGVPGSEDAIFATIEEAGRDRSELEYVLVTHSDGDHIGSLPRIVELTGARVYAGATEAEVVQGRQPSRGGQLFPGTAVDQIVADGDVLPIHGGVQVVACFGHSAGHVAYFLQAERTLIAGDAIGNTSGLSGSVPQYTLDPEQARLSVQRLAELEPDTICFGHGPPIVGSAAGRLHELAERVARG